jgi:hypothetical protein
MPKEASCALDVAEQGPTDNDELAEILKMDPNKVRIDVDSSLNALRYRIARSKQSEEFHQHI